MGECNDIFLLSRKLVRFLKCIITPPIIMYVCLYTYMHLVHLECLIICILPSVISIWLCLFPYSCDWGHRWNRKSLCGGGKIPQVLFVFFFPLFTEIAMSHQTRGLSQSSGKTPLSKVCLVQSTNRQAFATLLLLISTVWWPLWIVLFIICYFEWLY